RYFFIRQQDQLIALPAGTEDDLRILQSSLYIRKAGVRMGTVIREELVPEHELAVSTLINATVPGFDVDETTALDYLRREAIRIDTEFKGWALLRFAGLPLGWIKMLGNRINNYYPASWRILNK
ncbi:MAG TPA: RNA methyltransferase, partial [Ferruginibacter sp.]|nr:RNA methyltransferase [Ferruginibacter sp.]